MKCVRAYFGAPLPTKHYNHHCFGLPNHYIEEKQPQLDIHETWGSYPGEKYNTNSLYTTFAVEPLPKEVPENESYPELWIELYTAVYVQRHLCKDLQQFNVKPQQSLEVVAYARHKGN